MVDGAKDMTYDSKGVIWNQWDIHARLATRNWVSIGHWEYLERIIGS